MRKSGGFEAIVLGCSAGGFRVLSQLLPKLPAEFPIPVIVVQHRSRSEDHLLEEILQHKSLVRVKQSDEKELIKPGTVYIAPPDYHLMIEMDRSLSLSSDEPVNYSRPSIDVLFRSAADVYKTKLIGIIFSGANEDGANGTIAIHNAGGCTIAQNPGQADYPTMPQAAINTGAVDHILSVDGIVRFLLDQTSIMKG